MKRRDLLKSVLIGAAIIPTTLVADGMIKPVSELTKEERTEELAHWIQHVKNVATDVIKPFFFKPNTDETRWAIDTELVKAFKKDPEVQDFMIMIPHDKNQGSNLFVQIAACQAKGSKWYLVNVQVEPTYTRTSWTADAEL